MDLSIETVKEFILSRGGRVRNQELVNHYKRFLNDPNNKVPNRERFKDYVNRLATIKVDEDGQKILILKKKFRVEEPNLQNTGSSSSLPQTSSSEPHRPPSSHANTQQIQDPSRAQSEPPFRHGTDECINRTDVIQKTESEGNLSVSSQTSSQVSSALSQTSSQSSSSHDGPTSQASSSAESASRSSSKATPSTVHDGVEIISDVAMDENLANMSVKERAQHLNKIESESELQRAVVRRNDKQHARGEGAGDDDDTHSSGYYPLNALEREWMLTVCTGDYHPIAKLLSKNPHLAKTRDFTNTPLHWAAKHGKAEIVKMVAGKPGVNVNQRSGYTPLHLAAIHGHEDIIELLVQTYLADSNIRDYSGKKPKQYLRNSASTRTQQMLLSRRLMSASTGESSVSLSNETFLRSTSFRRSNRAKVLSSLMQVSSSVVRQQSMSSWREISSYEDEDVFEDPKELSASRSWSAPSHTPPVSGTSTPTHRRKVSLHSEYSDSALMPPPAGPGHMKKGKSSSRSREASPNDMGIGRTTSAPSLQPGSTTV